MHKDTYVNVLEVDGRQQGRDRRRNGLVAQASTYFLGAGGARLFCSVLSGLCSLASLRASLCYQVRLFGLKIEDWGYVPRGDGRAAVAASPT